MDGKARVKIGSFDRGGKSRNGTKADDHDYNPKKTVTPYGIFLPKLDELFLSLTESKVTSDFIVDILEDFWLGEKHRFSDIQTLVLNQDNGPQNRARSHPIYETYSRVCPEASSKYTFSLLSTLS
jgi:hypothetical protein